MMLPITKVSGGYRLRLPLNAFSLKMTMLKKSVPNNYHSLAEISDDMLGR